MNCAPNNKPPVQAGFDTARRISCARPFSGPGAMKLSLSIFLISLVTLTGCLSSDLGKFETKVRAWIPLGTPAADALRIMKHHGFECHLITTNNPFNPIGFDYLDCEKEQVRFHDWYARLILQDGRVSAYGPISTD